MVFEFNEAFVNRIFSYVWLYQYYIRILLNNYAKVCLLILYGILYSLYAFVFNREYLITCVCQFIFV